MWQHLSATFSYSDFNSQNYFSHWNTVLNFLKDEAMVPQNIEAY